MDCSFVTNRARDFGGAIYSKGGASVPQFSEAAFVNCRFVNNNATAGDGGAVHADDVGLAIVGCEFTHNTANAGRGGAVSIQCQLSCSRRASVVNCTLSRNDADDGGGIYIDTGGTTEVQNSIVWSNSGAGVDILSDQIAVETGSTVSVTNSCVQDNDPGIGPSPFGDPSNIDEEPSFIQLSVGNVRVLKGSPTIDAGVDALLGDAHGTVATDRDGTPRFFDDPDVGGAESIDMGCYETGHPTIVQSREGFSFSKYAFSLYIDPRAESTDGINIDLGLDEITLVFSEQVRDVGSTDDFPTPAAFTLSYLDDDSAQPPTPPAPPIIVSISDCVVPLGSGSPPGDPCAAYTYPGANPEYDGGFHVVVLHLDRQLATNEWLSIFAKVESLDGRRINGSDRVFVGYLPADVDQSGSVTPFDLLKFRQYVNGIIEPSDGAIEDFADSDRSGVVDPFDLLRFRQLVNGVDPATIEWTGQSMNAATPNCCP